MGGPGTSSTTKVKAWVVSGLVPLLAVMVKLYVPPEPAAGVPSKLAVSVPAWLVKVTPAGRAPVSDKVMSKPLLVRAGSPAVTSKVPAWPTVKVVVSAR